MIIRCEADHRSAIGKVICAGPATVWSRLTRTSSPTPHLRQLVSTIRAPADLLPPIRAWPINRTAFEFSWGPTVGAQTVFGTIFLPFVCPGWQVPFHGRPGRDRAFTTGLQNSGGRHARKLSGVAVALPFAGPHGDGGRPGRANGRIDIVVVPRSKRLGRPMCVPR